MTPLRVAFTTLGCKVNQSESDLYARQFSAAGYQCVPFEDRADVYVVNTCTVTHVADKKSRQMVNQARRTSPEALIVATGCYASIVGDALADDRTLVIRNRDKDRVVQLVEGRLGHAPENVASLVDPEKYLNAPSGQTRSRSMVKAQDGCDSHCTYCIIPRARGRSRSVSPEQVVRRVESLVEQGFGEIVLTGVDLGSYGEDDPSFPDLAGLIDAILNGSRVRRLRISSLEPGDFDQSWLDLWESPRLCRHLHIPLQSGSAAVLRRMERRYTPYEYLDMIEGCRARISELTVTTDVMVGFPGETHEEFDEGYQFVRNVAFDGIHVFKYSQRSGTRAARMPDQVPEDLKSARSSALRDEAVRGLSRLLDRHMGRVADVAWETERHGVWKGLSDTNIRVYGAPAGARQGKVSQVRLSQLFQDGAWGEPVVADIPLMSVP